MSKMRGERRKILTAKILLKVNKILRGNKRERFCYLVSWGGWGIFLNDAKWLKNLFLDS